MKCDLETFLFTFKKCIVCLKEYRKLQSLWWHVIRHRIKAMCNFMLYAIPYPSATQEILLSWKRPFLEITSWESLFSAFVQSERTVEIRKWFHKKTYSTFLNLQKQSYLSLVKFWRQIQSSLKRYKQKNDRVTAKNQLNMVLLMLLWSINIQLKGKIMKLLLNKRAPAVNISEAQGQALILYQQ